MSVFLLLDKLKFVLHTCVVCVQADLTLREGSGHFYVNASVKGIADVMFQESQGIAQVTFKEIF